MKKILLACSCVFATSQVLCVDVTTVGSVKNAENVIAEEYTIDRLAEYLAEILAAESIRAKLSSEITIIDIDESKLTLTKDELIHIITGVRNLVNGTAKLPNEKLGKIIADAVPVIIKLRMYDAHIIDNGKYYELDVNKLLPPGDARTDDKLLKDSFNMSESDENLKIAFNQLTKNGRKLNPILRNRLMSRKAQVVPAPLGEFCIVQFDDNVYFGHPQFPDIENNAEYWPWADVIENAISHEYGHFVHAGLSGIRRALASSSETVPYYYAYSKSCNSLCSVLFNDKLFSKDISIFGGMWQGQADILNVLGIMATFYSKPDTDEVKPIIIYDPNCENMERFISGRLIRLTHNSTCITENELRHEVTDDEKIRIKNVQDEGVGKFDESLSQLTTNEIKDIYKALTTLYKKWCKELKISAENAKS